MSASLVGSEMCIRDRRPPSFSAQPWGHRAKRGDPGARPCRWGPPTVRESVSYTHLTLPTICSV
eukprot:5308200-Alexandrium_andersonii.AAC.1